MELPQSELDALAPEVGDDEHGRNAIGLFDVALSSARQDDRRLGLFRTEFQFLVSASLPARAVSTYRWPAAP